MSVQIYFETMPKETLKGLLSEIYDARNNQPKNRQTTDKVKAEISSLIGVTPAKAQEIAWSYAEQEAARRWFLQHRSAYGSSSDPIHR